MVLLRRELTEQDRANPRSRWSAAASRDLPFDVTVFCTIDRPTRRGPSSRRCRSASGACDAATERERRSRASRQALQEGGFDYVVLFESSGMYNGEDVPGSSRT